MYATQMATSSVHFTDQSNFTVPPNPSVRGQSCSPSEFSMPKMPMRFALFGFRVCGIARRHSEQVMMTKHALPERISFDASSQLIPEQYPLLRTLQFSHNGYYRAF